MGFKAAPGEKYTIRRKILAILGAKFHVYDDQNKVIAFCQQKAFKLREDIRLYTDESKSSELLVLKARQVIDLGVTIDVTMPSGERLGSFRRKGMKSSFVRDEWLVMDADGREVATLKELGSFAPFARRYIDNAAAFLPQKFSLTRNADGVEIARYRQHFNLLVYRLGISLTAADDHMDELLVIALGSLVAAIEGRQG